VDGLTQFAAAPGVIDLAWGHPDPELLPVAELRAAAARALDRYGPDMLTYGNPAGPPPLREFISARLRETDARAPMPAETLVTGGTSQGLDMVTTLLVEPDDVVLLGEPTYYLALRILADHAVHMQGVASDEDGIVLEELVRAVRRLRGRRRRRPLLYTIPTFNNPTGISLSDDRRARLVEIAAEEGIVIIEDDTYRELAYDGPPPASLWSSAVPGVVVRLGSFAKSVAPGLRVGYLTADAPTVERIAASGVLDSGGSPSQFSALVLAEYARAGDYARVVERFRAAYRERRDRLLGALEEHLGGAATWVRPKGGYFVWVSLPKGVTAAALDEPAVRNGVGFMPAHRFYLEVRRAPEAIRLAFSRYPREILEEAVARLASAMQEATESEAADG